MVLMEIFVFPLSMNLALLLNIYLFERFNEFDLNFIEETQDELADRTLRVICIRSDPVGSFGVVISYIYIYIELFKLLYRISNKLFIDLRRYFFFLLRSKLFLFMLCLFFIFVNLEFITQIYILTIDNIFLKICICINFIFHVV